jgi:hypothetical protein
MCAERRRTCLLLAGALATAAGFSATTVLPVENDFLRFYCLP